MRSSHAPDEFPEISTPRLALRRWRPEDAPAIFRYRTHPDVLRFQSWRVATLEETHRQIARLAETPLNRPDSWVQIALVRQQDQQLVGDCGLHFMTDPRQIEIGVTVAPGHQRLGYACEAVSALLAFVFHELRKHRAFASVDPRNVAAMSLFKRLGMRQEAHFVESFWHDGRWVDDVIFALLNREWPMKP